MRVVVERDKLLNVWFMKQGRVHALEIHKKTIYRLCHQSLLIA
jgi:hypothetical protein